MSVKVPAPKHIIKYEGIFDYDRLYKIVYHWLSNQGYYVNEPTYKSKPGTAAGTEEEIELRAWRKVNNYVKYWIYVYFHVYDIKPMEIVKEGKKKKVIKARIWIELDAEVELDYNNRFEKSRFLEALRTFLNNIVLKSKIDVVWTDELYYRMLKLHKVIKEFLEMETKTNAYYDVW